MIKIVLADDHSIVRNGIRNLLEKESGIEVVGEAVNGGELLAMAASAAPDIIVADMNMPVIGGIEVAEKLAALGNPAKVMLLTMHDHQPYINRAFRAGVWAYLFKNIGADELLFAVRHVYSGKRYLSNELSLRLLDHVVNGLPANIPDAKTEVAFTERELDILKYIADGYTNQEIADRLFTSKRTVEGHRLIMISKAGVRNTASLIKFALNNGVL